MLTVSAATAGSEQGLASCLKLSEEVLHERGKMHDTSYARYAADPDVRLQSHALNAEEWRRLQTSYKVGELLMPCCEAAAIPKTSPYGLQFFAHAGGQCSSSPEGLWHLTGKETVAKTAREMGIPAFIEHSSTHGWRSDVWLMIDGAPVAVEIQHSYQHLRDYRFRQARYAEQGVRCLWLVMSKPYLTLLKSAGTQRWIEDFGRGKWPEGESQCLRDVPVGMLNLDQEQNPRVAGPRLGSSLHDVLQAFIENRFVWSKGAWVIDKTIAVT